MDTGKTKAEIESETLIANIQNGVAGIEDMKKFLKNNIKDCETSIRKYQDCLISVNKLSSETRENPALQSMMEYLNQKTSVVVKQYQLFTVLLASINNAVEV